MTWYTTVPGPFSLYLRHQKRHVVEAWALTSNFPSCATDPAFVQMEGLGGCLFAKFYFITQILYPAEESAAACRLKVIWKSCSTCVYIKIQDKIVFSLWMRLRELLDHRARALEYVKVYVETTHEMFYSSTPGMLQCMLTHMQTCMCMPPHTV